MNRSLCWLSAALLACLCSACAVSGKPGVSAPATATAAQLPLDSSELAFRRSRLISYDFVQSMIQLHALHPRAVALALAPSDSRFDEILVYSLTLAGYRAWSGKIDTDRARQNDDSQNDGLPDEYLHEETPQQDGPRTDLPRVVDPWLAGQDPIPAGSANPHHPAFDADVQPEHMTLTTRIVAEPPLLPGGESVAGVYAFSVSVVRQGLPDIRLRRLYRVRAAQVMPLGAMQVVGVQVAPLRADDAVFSASGADVSAPG